MFIIASIVFLAIPRVGFLPATDPRVRSTLEAIRRELTHEGLVYHRGNGTQELTKVELPRVLTNGGEAIGDLRFAQAVLIPQVTLDLTAQRLARSRQVA